jgi:hypothetical protein
MAVFYFLVEAEYFGFLNRQMCLRSIVCIGQVHLYRAQANEGFQEAGAFRFRDIRHI